jgi:hypothetical protein
VAVSEESAVEEVEDEDMRNALRLMLGEEAAYVLPEDGPCSASHSQVDTQLVSTNVLPQQ